MRILLLADIHANIVALETVLSHAPGYDAVWCLGDVVGYGPAPNECVERVRGLNPLLITGNHDQAVLGNVPLKPFSEDARRSLEWTIGELRPEHRNWLANGVPKQVLSEYDLTLVHASPRSPIWEYIQNAQIALENFPYFDTSLCLFAHTHRPIAYRLRVADHVLSPSYLSEQEPYSLQPKLLLNPGSVGQPRDGDPRAAYAILDLDSKLLNHHRIEYDVAATQRAILHAKLPYRLAARLAVGV